MLRHVRGRVERIEKTEIGNVDVCVRLEDDTTRVRCAKVLSVPEEAGGGGLARLGRVDQIGHGQIGSIEHTRRADADDLRECAHYFSTRGRRRRRGLGGIRSVRVGHVIAFGLCERIELRGRELEGRQVEKAWRRQSQGHCYHLLLL